MKYAFQVHIPNLTVTLFDYWLQEYWGEISDGDAHSILFPARRIDRKERRSIWAEWLVVWRKYGPNSITARQWKADTVAITATGPEEFCTRVAGWIFRLWGASASIQESEDQAGPPAWCNEGWYVSLTIEERDRYDRLHPFKENWEAGNITDKDLAALFGKTADTIRGWRRKLRNQGAPDMDWQKHRRV